MNAKILDEITVLVKDLRIAKSEVVRDLIEAEILKNLSAIGAVAENSNDAETKSVETNPDSVSVTKRAVPVYFDLWTKCDTCDIAIKALQPSSKNNKRKVLEHVYSPELIRVDSEHETVIRSYDKQNNVVYENGRLAGLCPNYTERLRKAFGEVQKAIAEGKAGLTSRFDEQTPEYAKSPDRIYSDDEIAKVDTPMVNPSNLLEPIDGDERKAAAEIAKSNKKEKSGKNRKKIGRKTAKKHAVCQSSMFDV